MYCSRIAIWSYNECNFIAITPTQSIHKNSARVSATLQHILSNCRFECKFSSRRSQYLVFAFRVENGNWLVGQRNDTADDIACLLFSKFSKGHNSMLFVTFEWSRARGFGHVALAIPFGLFSTTTAVAPLACVNTVCAKRAKNCQCSNYISSAHRQIYNTRFVERYFFLRFASCGTMAGCWWLGVRLMRPFLFSPKKEPIGGIDFAIGTKSAIHIQCRCANERLMDESAMEKSREMHFCCCCCLTALLIVV